MPRARLLAVLISAAAPWPAASAQTAGTSHPGPPAPGWLGRAIHRNRHSLAPVLGPAAAAAHPAAAGGLAAAGAVGSAALGVLSLGVLAAGRRVAFRGGSRQMDRPAAPSLGRLAPATHVQPRPQNAD